MSDPTTNLAVSNLATQRLWQVDVIDDRLRLLSHGEVRLRHVEAVPA